MMQKHKTPAGNSDIEVFNINFFYKKFQTEKRRYHPSLFCIGEKTKKKRKKGVSFSLYKKIVLEYLKLYFFELYMNSNPEYFPLGGFVKKVLYSKWARFQSRGKTKKTLTVSEGAIGLFWYMRPSIKMYYMVSLKKLTGSSNRIPKIEKIFKDNFNKDLLPIFKTEIKKGSKNKTLYRYVF